MTKPYFTNKERLAMKAELAGHAMAGLIARDERIGRNAVIDRALQYADALMGRIMEEATIPKSLAAAGDAE